MKLATVLFVALLTAPLLVSAAAPEPSTPSRGRSQVLAVEVSVLRAEFHKGWQSSSHVSMQDTYGSFVTRQVNYLIEGDYFHLLPELRKQVEALDRDTSSRRGRSRPGSWEPLGWAECDRELLLFRRTLR
jgi:hypothetical protein